MSISRSIGLSAAVILCALGALSLLRGVWRRVTRSQNMGAHAAGIIPLAIGVGVFAIVWYGFAFAEPPVLFLRALRDGNARQAFNMLTESAQTDVGGYEDFQAWAEAVRPQSWLMGSSCGVPGKGRSDGSVRLVNGERSSISFHVAQEYGAWQIAGVHLWDMDSKYWLGTGSGLDCSDD